MRERSVTRCRKSQLLGFGLPLRRGKVQIGLIFKSRIQDVACGCLLVAGALLPPVPPGNQLQQLAAILDLSPTFLGIYRNIKASIWDTYASSGIVKLRYSC